MANKVQVVIEGIGNFQDVIRSVQGVQGSLDKLKVPQDLKTKFDQIFKGLEKDATRAQELLESGFKNKSDLTAYNKAVDGIVRSMRDMDTLIEGFDSGKLADVFKIDNKPLLEAANNVKELKQELNQKLDTQQYQVFSNAITKLGSTSKAKSIRDVMEAFRNNDLPEVIKQLDEVDNYIEKLNKRPEEKRPGNLADIEKGVQAVRNALKGLESVDDIDKLVQKVREAEEIFNNLNTANIEKAKQAWAGIQQQVSKISKPVQEAKDNIKGFGQNMAEANREIDQLKNRVAYFFGLNNAVNLLRRTIQSAIQSVKDLDKAMTETAVVTDFSVSDMWEKLPEYTAAANALGTTTLGAYQTMTLFYQQGLKTNEVFEVGTETMKMARIAGLDYTEATDMMTAALRGFNMEINETSAQRINDVYSQLAAHTASNTQEIATAMTKVASLAHNAGMEFETASAFLAQGIETTRESAENIGTALKTVVARFQELKKAPSEIGEVDGEIVDANKIETALRTIDVALRDTTGQFRNLDEVFLEISQKWDTLDKNTQRYIATQAAGSRQQSRFIAMMSDYSRTMELVDMANNSAGASNAQFEKTVDSLESKINKLKNAWQQFTMGIANNKAIKIGVDALTAFIKAINKITSIGPPAIQSISKIMLAFAGFKTLRKILNQGIVNIGTLFLNGGRNAGKQFGDGLLSSLNKISAYFSEGLQTQTLEVATNALTKYNAANAAVTAGAADLQAAEQLKAAAVMEYAAATGVSNTVAQASIELQNLDVSASTALEAAKHGLTASRLQELMAQEANQGKTAEEIALTYADSTAQEVLMKSRIVQIAAALLQTVTLGGVTAATVQETIADWAAKAAIDAKTASMLISLGIIGLIILAIMALVAAIALLIKTAHDNTPEQQLKKLHEQTEKAQEAAENAQKAYETLRDAVESIREQEIVLEEMTEGTNEWKEAVAQLNQEVITLLENYPKLAPYITYSDGKFSFTDEDAVDDIIAEAERGSQNATANSQWTRIDELQGEIEVAYDKYANMLNAAIQAASPDNEYAANLPLTRDRALTEEIARGLAEGWIAKGVPAAGQITPEQYLQEAQKQGRIGNFEAPTEEAIQNLYEFGRILIDFETQIQGLIDVSNHYAESITDVSASAEEGAAVFNTLSSTRYDDLYQANLEKARSQEIRNSADYLKYFQDSYGYDANGKPRTLRVGNQGGIRNPSGARGEKQVKTADEAAEEYARYLTRQQMAEMAPDIIAGIYQLKDPIIQALLLGQELNEEELKELAGKDLSFINFPKVLQELFGDPETFRTYLESNQRQAQQQVAQREEVLKNTNALTFGRADQISTDALIGLSRQKNLIDTTALSNEFQNAFLSATADLDAEELEDFLKALNSLDLSDTDSIKGFDTLLGDIAEDVPIEALQNFKSVLQDIAFSITNVDWAGTREKIATSMGLVTDLKGRDIEDKEFTQEERDALIEQNAATAADFRWTGENFVLVNGTLGDLIAALESNTLALSQNKVDELQRDIDTGEQVQAYLDTLLSSQQNALYDVANGDRNIDTDRYAMNETNRFLDSMGYNTEELNSDQKTALIAQLIDIFSYLNQNKEQMAQAQQDNADLQASRASGQELLNQNASSEEIRSAAEAQNAVGKSTEELINDFSAVNAKAEEFGDILLATAIDTKKFNDQIDKSCEVISDEIDAMKKTADGTEEYEKSINNIQDAIKDAFGVEVDDDWVKNNLPDLEKWVNGNEDAFNRLRDKMIDAFAQANPEIYSRLDDIRAAVAEIDNLTFDVNGYADASDIFTKLVEVYQEMGKTAAEAEELAATTMNAWGFDVTYDVVYEPDTISIPSIAYTDTGGGGKEGIRKPGLGGNVSIPIKKPKYVATASKTNAPGGGSTGRRGGGSGGGGGGGGGGGSKEEEWENDFDKYYNLVQDIAEEERKLAKIQFNYNKLLDSNLTTGQDIYANLKQQEASLERQRDLQQQMLGNREQEMRDLMSASENADLKDYIWYNWNDRTLEIDWDDINKVKDTELGDRLSDFLSKAEDIEGKMDDAEDRLMDIDEQIRELRETGHEEYDDLESRVLDAIVNREQEAIDKLSNINESINSANEKLLNSVQENIDKIRQDRENEKKEQELADKEARLQYLRQDTSGANALEIMQLEKELDDARQEYTDNLIDQKLSDLQLQNDKAAEQREHQIDLQQKALDEAQRTGKLWAEAYQLMDENLAGGKLIDGQLKDLLQRSETWEAMSNHQKEDWAGELVDTVNLAWSYIQHGQSVESRLQRGEMTKGQSIEFTDSNGNRVKGTISADGKTISVKSVTGTTSYSTKDVYQSWDGVLYTTSAGTFTSNSTDNSGSGSGSGGSGGSGGSNNNNNNQKQYSYPYGKVSNGSRNLSNGSSGDDVRALQSALNQLGFGNYGTDPIDGRFGTGTRDAVMAFQRYMKIGVDGVVGPETRKAFKSMQFKTGGLANYTGIAWLDGTPSRPELVLNAKDTENFIQLKDVLQDLTKNGGVMDNINGNMYFNIEIAVDKIDNDYDVDQLAERIKDNIYKESMYRNVNAINLLR